MWVCERENERERERCVCVRERGRERVCVRDSWTISRLLEIASLFCKRAL